MNKQEEELIQYIIHQTQIDRETILRILNRVHCFREGRN